jgi:monoamine oxidase
MTPVDQALRRVQVAIVGAGASGLTCAAKLLRSSSPTTSVLILEARDRIGGRIYTTKEKRRTCKGQDVTFHVDHGATWVHGTSIVEDGEKEINPMISLLEQVGSLDQQLIESFSGNPWMRPQSVLHEKGEIAIYMDGKLIPKDSTLIPQAIHRHYKIMKEVSHLANHFTETGQETKLIHTSVEQVMREIEEKNGHDEDASEALDLLVPYYTHLKEGWHGQSSSDLQLGDFTKDPSILAAMKTDEFFTPDGDYDGPHCIVKEGMSTLMEPLMAQVGDHVHLNQQVVKIQEADDGVRLETKSGMIVEADCCVITVPVGCLKASYSELFDPPLPVDKIEAINAMATGVYKKILLTFDRIFWPADETFVGFIRRSSPNGIGKNLMVYNLWAHRDIPCMEAVLFGNAGKWAINQSDETIRNAILEFLEEAMGLSDIKGWCVDCHVTRWEEDPFTRGAYTSFSLGTSERHVEALQRSEWNGRLIFSGEATTCEYMGSVHAALISGQEAVHSVEDFLRKGNMQAMLS